MIPDPITRFIKATDVVTHFKVLKTASEECDDYEWLRAGEKVYSRSCPHCDERIEGSDLDDVKRRHREHIAGCEKNPANKATVEPEQKTEEETKMTPEPETPKTYTHPDGTEFPTAEALMDYNTELQEAEQMTETRALIPAAQPDQPTQIAIPAWSDEQLDVMRKTVADNATPAEFAYFLNVAAATGLNPFLREIYFMKTEKGQTAIITGRDGYLTIAKRDPRFMGIQSMEVCDTDEFEMGYTGGRMCVEKHKITDFVNRGSIIGAWARGKMQGQESVTLFVSIKEYDKGGNVWKVYKSAMIRKVAESMVLKRIAGISGLVTEAEISDSKMMVLDAEVV